MRFLAEGLTRRGEEVRFDKYYEADVVERADRNEGGGNEVKRV
jgi:hypothetical protein